MKHCLEATVNIYKIAWGDLPKQMAVEYWFPNQEVKTSVNNYVGKDGNEDSNKGKEAVQSGEVSCSKLAKNSKPQFMQFEFNMSVKEYYYL